jgi:hypothetical protein
MRNVVPMGNTNIVGNNVADNRYAAVNQHTGSTVGDMRHVLPFGNTASANNDCQQYDLNSSSSSLSNEVDPWFPHNR